MRPNLAIVLLVLLAGLLAGCNSEPVINNYYTYVVQGGDDDAIDTEDTDVVYISNLPDCDSVVSLNELPIDLWGADGHLFYIEVSPEQRELADSMGCVAGFDYDWGVYDLADESNNCPTYADNIRIVPVESTTCADSGKVEVSLVGQSSYMPWADIPNFKIDTDEFVDGLKFSDGTEHLRLNNGQANATVIREPTALAIWRAMGYPAPQTRFVETHSNVWDTEYGEGTWATHVMVQPYKDEFFGSVLPEAVYVWEGYGDPFADWYEGECQWTNDDDCNDDALQSIVEAVQAVPMTDGFMAATSSVIDWNMVFRNQCLSALTGTGDDWIHGTNNVVIVIREDGKLMYLPYSTDISADHPWHTGVTFDGWAYLPVACQYDEACRRLSVETCFEMVDRFEELNVVETIVEERCGTLDSLGLAREPDDDACEDVAQYYSERPETLRAELNAILECLDAEEATPDSGEVTDAEGKAVPDGGGEATESPSPSGSPSPCGGSDTGWL